MWQGKLQFMRCVYAFGTFVTCLSFSSPVFAGLYGADQAASTAGLPNSQITVVDVVANVVSAALSLIGVLFFILTIYGGVTWMVARGNEEYTKRALDTIVAAIIGLIIVIAAYAITQFVYSSITGA